MATTTVRLDDDEERMLDRLAVAHGGRSNALKAGLRLLDAADQRATALDDLLTRWHDAADGGSEVDESLVDDLVERYDLAP